MPMLPRVLFAAVLAVPVAWLFTACSAGDVSPPPPIGDAGGLDGQNVGESGGEGGGAPIQKGKIVDLTGGQGVVGATVTLGGTTTQTDSSGKYQGAVDPTKSS